MTAEINKALVFKDGKVQRIKDDQALEVGVGLKMQEAGEAPLAEDAFGKLYSLSTQGTSSTTLYFMDDAGTSHYLQPDGIEQLAEPQDGQFAVDFDPGLPSMRTVVLTQATDFSSVADTLQAGRSVALHIKNNTESDIEITFPSTTDAEGVEVSRWTWLGGTTPTVIPANTDSILSLVSLGTTEDDMLAAFSYDDSEQITGQGTPDYLAVFENPRDIRSAFLYLYEEDGDGANGVTRLGIGQGFGPEFEEDGTTSTGLTPPEVSLQVASNQPQTEAILKLQSNDDAFKMFALNSAPEGAITGDIGDIAVDGTNGSLYFKSSGGNTTTGWVRFATDTQTYAVQGTLLANEVAYFVGGSNNTVARATALATADGNFVEARVAGLVVAVVAGEAQVQTDGVFKNAAFETGLTLAAGQPVYLSKTAGKLTNSVTNLGENEVVAEIGIIVNAASNVAADVLIQPKPIVVL